MTPGTLVVSLARLLGAVVRQSSDLLRKKNLPTVLVLLVESESVGWAAGKKSAKNVQKRAQQTQMDCLYPDVRLCG